MIGKTLAHYKIVDQAGAGGMGDVYVAEDTKLSRKVALKVLPEDLANDPERLARFDREAKTVAGLNHPNIVTLHSVEEADGLRFLTMELVEGQTLADLRKVKEPTLETIFDLFIPMADALYAAHQQGVVHRDLKPANVMVTDEGRLKILDFGLAKLHEADTPQDDRTRMLGSDLTEPGKVFGTVPYMSPEQVQGKPVDHRSDIFSAGILLYEMITGDRPFTGETAAEQISSVLRDQPSSVTQVKRGLPRHLGRIVQRCLEKDPNRRYQTALDLRNELEMLRDEFQTGELHAVAGEIELGVTKPRGASWTIPILAAFLGAVLGGWIMNQLGPGGAGGKSAGQPTSFEMLTYQTGRERDVHFSPDASMVVYTSDAGDVTSVMLQRVGGARPILLTENDDASDPAFSPDGQLVAYRSEQGDGGLFIMGATGESARRLTEFGYCPAWSPDGSQIAFSAEDADNPAGRNVMSSLWVADVESGETRQVTDHDAVHPRWSPNGHRIAFWGMEGEAGSRDIWTIRPDGTDMVPVTGDSEFDYYPVWSPDGRHLYFASERGGPRNLWRVRIDEKSGQVLGGFEPVTTPTKMLAEFDLSADGTQIVFGNEAVSSHIVRFEFDPASETVGDSRPLAAGATLAGSFDTSPDGERIAFGGFTTQEDIYTVNADGSSLRRLTDDGFRDRGPSFTHDSERIRFYSDRSGRYEIWEVQTDGSGLRQVTATDGRSFWFPRVSPDGTQMLAFNEQGTIVVSSSHDLVSVAEDDRLPNPSGDLIFQAFAWSPDGRRLVGGVDNRGAVTQRGLYAWSLADEEYQVLVDDVVVDDADWIDDDRVLFLADEGTLGVFEISTSRRTILKKEFAAKELGVPDGCRYLAVREFRQESDLWIATLGGGDD